MTTVYISIGNSDDKLTQREWSAFTLRTHLTISGHASKLDGSWYSGPGAERQTACWCAEVSPDVADRLRGDLRQLAREFRQDSIAWAEATTEFIGAAE